MYITNVKLHINPCNIPEPIHAASRTEIRKDVLPYGLSENMKKNQAFFENKRRALSRVSHTQTRKEKVQFLILLSP
jgi:hypothetical protein